MKVAIASLIALTAVFSLSAPASISLSQAKLGNVFYTTETPQIPLTCTGNEIDWVVTDYYHNTVGSGTVTPSGGSATIQPNLGKVGYFDVAITEKNNGTTTATAATSFAVLTPISVISMSNSPFGTQTHFSVYTPTAIDPVLARAGIAQVRDEQPWNNIEPTKGSYSFPYDSWMSTLSANSINPMITLDFGNPNYDTWYGQFTAPTTTDSYNGYANYGNALLNHYGTQIKSIEIWNEYNGSFIAGPATNDPPTYYVNMLKQAYTTIKTAHPSVTVAGGGVVPVAAGFLKAICDKGAMPYMDVISLHPYRGNPEGLDVELSSLRTMLKGYNGGVEKPLWATEFNLGANSAADQFTEGPYVAQICTIMLSQNVQRMYYFLAIDDGDFNYWGLMSQMSDPKGPYTPHPTYVVYANLIRQLYGYTFQNRFANTATTTYAYKFTNAGNQTSVLWAQNTTSVKLATASSVTVTDIVGTQKTLTPSGGYVTLTLSPQVQYVSGSVTSVTEVNNPLIADSLCGFTATQGANGWYYGYANKGPTDSYATTDFQPMSSYGITASGTYSWLGTSTYHLISSDQMSPASAWAIKRWVSNQAGTVTLSGSASRAAGGGDGVNVRIFVDGTQVYTQHLDSGVATTFNIPNITIHAGSDVDFTVNQNNEGSFDSTGFLGQVTLTSGAATPLITSGGTASGTVGSAFSYTITGSNSPTSYGETGTLPGGLTLNTGTGVISGTPTAAGTSSVSISATNAGGTGSASLTFTINPSGGGTDTIRFFPRAGQAGRMVGGIFQGTNGDPVNGTYTNFYTISATPADGIYTTVPASGLSSYRYLRYLSPVGGYGNVAEVEFDHNGAKINGAGYGNPGSFQGDPTLTYAAALDGNTSTYFDGPSSGGNYTGIDTATAGSAPVITSATSAAGTVGTAFSYTIAGSNSPTSYGETGTLPSGLTLNTGTGVISGTPMTAGSSSVTISATNAAGTGSATLAFTINAAGSPPVITSTTTASGTVGAAFSYSITGSNNPTSYSETGTLPAGLTLNGSTGAIAGTPTTAGTSSITINATNSYGTGSASLALTINAAGGDSIKFYPRVGWAGRMLGGIFQGTNGDPVSGTYTTFYTISTTPADSVYTTVPASGLTGYRYLRYLSPDGGYGNVAEVEFDHNGVKLTGAGYGSAGSFQNDPTVTYAAALDGNPNTYFDGPSSGGNYTGVDTGAVVTTYALTVNSGTGSGTYAAGAAVAVSANSAPANQYFSGWTGNTSGLASTTAASTTLTMPPAATSITANYRYTLTSSNLTAQGLTGTALGTGTGSSGVRQTGDYEITGAGTGLSGMADSAWYESQTISGDFTAVVQAKSLTANGSASRAGLMLREGTSSGARFAEVAAVSGVGYVNNSRVTTGGTAAGDATSGSDTFANKWLRIVRAGNVVTLATSSTGSSYTTVNTITFSSLAASVNLGLVVTSGTSGVSDVASFGGYTVTPAGGSDTIKFFPRGGLNYRMVGGVFEATNGDPVTGTYTTLYTITATPTDGVWTSVSASGLSTYRYLRYRGGNSSFTNVAEVEFDHNGVKINGTVYGTAGSYQGDGYVAANVYDGNTSTFFDGPDPAGDYAGIDTGTPAGYAPAVTSATTASGTVGAAFTYTITGSNSPTSYGETGTMPAGLSLNTGTGVISGTPTTSGTSSVTISATNAYGTGSATLAFTIAAGGGGGLPSPWTDADIGAVGAAGSATYASSTFTLKGSGADVWDVADAFNYTSQNVSGNSTVIARVTSVSNSDSWAKAGVMIRNSTSAGAANAFCFVTPGGNIVFQTRASDGATTSNSILNGSAPVWVKVVRSGTSLSGYYSSDGATWNQVGPTTAMTLNTSAPVGLAVTAHANGSLCTATFSNASVSSP